MIAGDKVWTVLDILPALPPIDPRAAEYVGEADGTALIRRVGNPQVIGVDELHRVFDCEEEAWAYAAQRLRQHAEHVLDAAEKAAAKARQATVVRVGL